MVLYVQPERGAQIGECLAHLVFERQVRCVRSVRPRAELPRDEDQITEADGVAVMAAKLAERLV